MTKPTTDIDALRREIDDLREEVRKHVARGTTPRRETLKGLTTEAHKMADYLIPRHNVGIGDLMASEIGHMIRRLARTIMSLEEKGRP